MEGMALGEPGATGHTPPCPLAEWVPGKNFSSGLAALSQRRGHSRMHFPKGNSASFQDESKLLRSDTLRKRNVWVLSPGDSFINTDDLLDKALKVSNC